MVLDFGGNFLVLSSLPKQLYPTLIDSYAKCLDNKYHYFHKEKRDFFYNVLLTLIRTLIKKVKY